jgi:hypothetical protein
MSKLYRYENHNVAERKVAVRLCEFHIVKETKCFYFIDYFAGLLKRVSKKSNKKYAASTKEAALESFKARKIRQIKILNRQLEEAKAALAISNAASFSLDLGGDLSLDSFSLLKDGG